MLSFTQKKKTLSKQKPHHCVIPAFGAMVNRCKVQTTELCICQYNSAPEQGTAGSQPSPCRKAEKMPGDEKLMRRRYDKRWQADPEQPTPRLRPPDTYPAFG